MYRTAVALNPGSPANWILTGQRRIATCIGLAGALRVLGGKGNALQAGRGVPLLAPSRRSHQARQITPPCLLRWIFLGAISPEITRGIWQARSSGAGFEVSRGRTISAVLWAASPNLAATPRGARTQMARMILSRTWNACSRGGAAQRTWGFEHRSRSSPL